MKKYIEDYITILMTDKKRLRSFVCNTLALLLLVQLFTNVIHKSIIIGGNVSTLSYHFLDYTLGFTTRGLYGATLGKLASVLPLSIYTLFWFVLILIPYVFFYVIYRKRTAEAEELNDVDLFMFFAFSLPTTLLPTMDLFRLDILNYSIFIITAYFCWQRQIFRFLLPLSVILMILIHEASLFMFIPALGAVVLFRARKNFSDWLLVFLYGASALAGTALYWIARNTPISPEKVNELINSRCSYVLGEKLDLSPHFSSITSGYINWMIENTLSWHWLWMEILAIPFVLIAWRIFRAYWKNAKNNFPADCAFDKFRFWLLWAAPFSFLILFIGCDFNRWYWAFFSTNIFLLCMLLTEKKDNWSFLTAHERLWIAFVGVMFLFMQVGYNLCFSKVITSLAAFLAFVCQALFPGVLKTF